MLDYDFNRLCTPGLQPLQAFLPASMRLSVQILSTNSTRELEREEVE